MNRQELLDAIVAAIYENTSGAITGQSLQDTLKEIVNAFTFIDEATAQPAGGMLPGVLYNLGEVTGSVVFSLAAGEGEVNHYYFTFDTSASGAIIAWPSEVLSWFGDYAPYIDPSRHYEVSILNGVGVCMSSPIPE